MRIIFFFLVFFVPIFGVTIAAQSSPSPQQNQINVMPLPAKVQLGTGHFAIDQSFSVSLEGAIDPRLNRAVRRFIANLSRQTGIPMGAPAATNRKALLTVRADHPSKPVQELGEDESYT